MYAGIAIIIVTIQVFFLWRAVGKLEDQVKAIHIRLNGENK